jgi:hypothetical protein
MRARTRPCVRILVQAVFLAVNAVAVNNLSCMLEFARQSPSIDLPSVFIPLLPREVDDLLRVPAMFKYPVIAGGMPACAMNNVLCLAVMIGNLQVVDTLRKAYLHARVECAMTPPHPSSHSVVRSRCTPTRAKDAPDTTLLRGGARPRESCALVVGFRCAHTLPALIVHPEIIH